MNADDDILDLAIEAAVDPARWIDVLDLVARRAGAVSATMIAFDDPETRPRWWATAPVRDIVDHWVEHDLWRSTNMERKIAYAYAPRREACVKEEFHSVEIWHADPTFDLLRRSDLDHQMFAPLFSSADGVFLLSCERHRRDGAFAPDERLLVDRLVPHVARAARLSAQLRIDRAEATARGLEIVGLAAAIVSPVGRLRAANRRFARFEDVLIDTGLGRLRLADPVADGLFRDAFAAIAGGRIATRSIPVLAAKNRPPLVVHLVSLRRSAREIFPGGDVLVAVAEIGGRGADPSLDVLRLVFGLTPAEARFAALLASGRSAAAAAEVLGVTRKTARTYLERIFAKTGVHRQNELLAVLRDLSPPFS